MNNEVLLYALICLLGVFIGAVSQVMLKKAAMAEHKNAIAEYMNPLVIFAYVLFVLTTFISVIAYKKIPLSLGPILEATSYIYVTYFGLKFFGEKLNKGKVIAIAMIITGIFIYAFFG